MMTFFSICTIAILIHIHSYQHVKQRKKPSSLFASILLIQIASERKSVVSPFRSHLIVNVTEHHRTRLYAKKGIYPLCRILQTKNKQENEAQYLLPMTFCTEKHHDVFFLRMILLALSSLVMLRSDG